MYTKVSANLDFAQREMETLRFWKENNIFEKSAALRADGPAFTFYEGPPTANGRPHVGHVETRAVKDLIPRYRTMKGCNVLRKAGWDTHGLPVELEVERALGISGKPQIEEYGVEPFIQKCKESVWKYKGEWEDMSDRVGFWADMNAPYITYENAYIESVWWALKQIWEKDLLYKGHKIVPYCPRCGTALSSHEVAQGYKDVKETSVYVKFRLKDSDAFILVWTTTPWTLPSNVALAVNARETYAKVRCGDETYILAAALAEEVLKSIAPYDILETFSGAALEGKEYESLFRFYDTDKKCCYVISGDYVTLTEGTGVVHIAPAFGEDDARLGRQYDLPFIQLVNEQGNFLASVTPWAGMFVKTADPFIIKMLKETGRLLKTLEFEHSYPFCWRCDTPLLYYARDTWFIQMTSLRERLLANNDTVNWLPENVKAGRFGNFLENVVDWGLSRERYWGTPLPIWECGCGHRHAVGSVAELLEMAPGTPPDIELHKPYIDAVLLDCPKCGGKMKRVSEVIDCWFDSGAMPFAQWHYPFENKDCFDKFFPADFISEAVDQTRGWFYSLLAIGTLVFDRSPYQNVIVMGHVNDKYGQKMSKHKGNVVDPWEVLDKQGADAVRWYFYTVSAPWLPSRFYEDAVGEAQRKFMGTFWNTYAFFVLYAEIDQFNPIEHPLDDNALTIMDRWILSRLHSLIQRVDQDLARYEITEPARALSDFIDDLSNWYLRRSRGRFWGSEMSRDKSSAYAALYHTLVNLAKLAAPFVPFMTEAIYQNLVRHFDASAPESIHLTNYPEANPARVDAEMEKHMRLAMRIAALGRAARNEAAIKNRQPIALMYVQAPEPLPETYQSIVLDELNVKEMQWVDDAESFVTYRFKPQLRALGPRYGKLVSKIGAALAAADGTDLMRQLKQGQIQFSIDGTDVALGEPDVLIESGQKEGTVTASDKGVTVVLSTVLTPELIEEGFVREIVSKVQTMRKEAGFEVTDRISLYYAGSDRIAGVVQRNRDAIAADVLANQVMEGQGQGYAKQWDINGEPMELCVRR
ncbi:MAG: isoleucine--tRNA ligase [Clostridiales bacterium]|jgi:isoleucyl-tRNA synthetase|nr:isoleucine--tRNA ligase [Clostridiales bacterium]